MIRRLLAVIVLLGVGSGAGYFFARHPSAPVNVTANDDQIRQRLLSSVELHNTTLPGAIRYARDVTGLGLSAHWSMDTKVADPARSFDPDLSFHNITVGQFLGRLNRSLDRTQTQVQFRAYDGCLNVAPGSPPTDFGDDAEADYRNTVTCVYNVQTLLRNDGPWERLAIPPDGTPRVLPLNYSERCDVLQHTLMQLVEADSWRDAGGLTGSMRTISGQLIVTQTPPNQRAIYEIIKTLRAAK